MKKKLFTLTLILFATEATAQVSINATNFPDPNFRNYLLEQWYGRDGKLTDAEIAKVNEIEVGDRNVANLKGIEHFTALTILFCWNNQLTSLDLSKNTALTLLNCVYNQLTTLDLSKNKALSILACDGNQLGTLDVSKNTALDELHCSNNQLSTIDLSKNLALTQLFCNNNQLTTLDLSRNTELAGLWCNINSLTSLNVSGNAKMYLLDCSNNQLTMLDLSKNIALETLNCYGNQLTSLDLSKNMVLNDLSCYHNQIKGEGMQVLVESLPTVENGDFLIINSQNTDKQNVITKEQVKIAKGKGWIAYDLNGSSHEKVEYEGSDALGVQAIENLQLTTDDGRGPKGKWHTIDGKKLRGELMRKGLYVKDKKKIVVKPN